MKKLTEEFNKASVKVGEAFVIILPSSTASTGYGWDVEVKSGKTSLLAKDFLQPAAPPGLWPAIGAESKQVFVYRAEEPGTIEIEAKLQRPWEKTPVKTKSFWVTVQ
jgi:predicted secreted protein